jgi:hypothetical protein
VGRRRARAARVDGLGDRDRSLSPDGEGAWETMLTTLTPDPQLPSAGSSFMSVSATTSGSSNAESTNTSLTTMGSTPNVVDRPNVGSEPVCDLVDDSSSDTSDTEDELYLHDRMTRERFQRGCRGRPIRFDYKSVHCRRPGHFRRHAADCQALG